MKLNFNLTFILFWLSLPIAAQVITVTNKADLQPIVGVNITFPETNITFSTNHLGQADISAINQSGAVEFWAVGYQYIRLDFNTLQRQNYRVLLTESSYALGEIVVSASRFAEKKEEVPQPIQVLRKEDIAFMGQATTADVLQQTGNVLVQKSQLGGGSPIIRGFEANKVLLVVDGVRMNNAIYRGGHLQNVITLDNAILDRAEVIFGPGSVVYGSDALGGVMHFYTRNPELAPENQRKILKGQAFTRYASAAQEKTGHAEINLGFRNIAFLSAFTYTHFSDLRQGKHHNQFPEATGLRRFYVQRFQKRDSMIATTNPNLLRPTGYRQYDFLQKIKFQPNANGIHTLNLQYSTSSDIPRYDRLTLLGNNSQPRFAEWYYGPQKRFFSAYTFDKKGSNFFYQNARFIAGYQRIEESRQDRAFRNNILNSRVEQVNVYSLNLDFEKEAGKNEFRYGLEGNYNQVHSSAYRLNIVTDEKSPLDTRYPNGGSDMQTVAAYFTHAYEASPKFIIHDGLRYSQVKLTANFEDKTFFPFPFDHIRQNNGALNGNLGLTFLPGKAWRLAALASSGFRAPNVDDLSKVFESVTGTIIVPNPDLQPEFTYNTEITIAKGFRNKIRVEATGYHTWYRQAITTQPGTFNGENQILYQNQLSQVLTNKNAQQAYIYGFSGSLTADLSPAISLASSLNYTLGRIKTDSADYPLDHIPPLFGRTSIKLNLKKFRGEFFVLYNGRKALADYNLLGEDNFAFATPNGLPAWYTLNIRTAYQIHPRLQIQANLENIADRHYRVFASTISAAGRNLSLTLRGNF